MKDLIKIQEFCTYYKIPNSFMESLYEYELIEIVVVNKETHIEKTHIAKVEKLMRLHYDLGINFEGLDAILNLLKQVDFLQNEIRILNNKLDFYK